MGVDFIRRTAKTFTKSWSNNKVRELSNPTLFTRTPECRTRTAIAQLNDRANLPPGTELSAWVRDATLILVHETVQVGVIDQPPPDIFRTVREAGGCALTRLGQLNPLSGTADVEFK